MKTVISTPPIPPPLPSPTALLTHAPEDTRAGVFFMTFSVLCFTANTLLIKYLGSVRGIDFSLNMLVRALVGVIIVFFFYKSRRPLEIKAAIFHPRLILRGLLGVAGTAAFYYTIPILGAGKASLIGTTYVLFAALLAAIFLGERLSRTKSAWLLLAFVGVALLTGTDVVGGARLGHAEIIALTGALTAGWVVGLIRQLTLRYSNSTIYFSQCFWITLTVIPLICLRPSLPGWTDLGIMILAAIAGSYGQIAMVQAYRHLAVAKGASIQMALPVTASLGGFLLFGETFTALQIGGAALTLLGTWRVVASRR